MKPAAAAGRPRTFIDLVWISARKFYERFIRSDTQHKLDRLTHVVEQIAARQKQDAKWRSIFRLQLEALVRDAYLSDSSLPADRSLALRRFRLRLTGEVDLMSIDIDSCDYWLLEALEACSPRVLIMEYNALFGPKRAVTLPNAPLPYQRPKGYFGASLAALEKMAAKKGYRLVLCEEKGVNAFFLRNNVAWSIPA